MQWLARVIPYEAFSPESTMTLFLYPTFFCLIFEEDDESDTEDNQEDGEEEGEGDFHQHAAEHGSEEQREAETDVQDQVGARISFIHLKR